MFLDFVQIIFCLSGVQEVKFKEIKIGDGKFFQSGDHIILSLFRRSKVEINFWSSDHGGFQEIKNLFKLLTSWKICKSQSGDQKLKIMHFSTFDLLIVLVTYQIFQEIEIKKKHYFLLMISWKILHTQLWSWDQKCSN